MEPRSNCSSASGGSVFADAAAVMQAVESQTLVLYHTDLRGQWPEERARALARRLPYLKRLLVTRPGEAARASLAGIALALRALARATGCTTLTPELLRFPHGAKPHLLARPGTPPGSDFSIAHSGPLVGCAALGAGRVGFDLEYGSGAHLSPWVAREAAAKAAGQGVRALHQVELVAPGARLGDQSFHARALAAFPGAVSCVMTSVPVHTLEIRAVALTELFAS